MTIWEAVTHMLNHAKEHNLDIFKTEVELDGSEPSQPLLYVGHSTSFDGKVTLCLTNMEYDIDKIEFTGTCDNCGQVRTETGPWSVCSECHDYAVKADNT